MSFATVIAFASVILVMVSWPAVWRYRSATAQACIRAGATRIAAPKQLADVLSIDPLDDRIAPLPAVDIPSVPEWVTTDKAAFLDGVLNVYGNWSYAKAAMTGIEEMARVVASSLETAKSIAAADLADFAHMTHDATSFLHHMIDPHLWHWFQSTGGVDFIHIVSTKVSALDGGAHEHVSHADINTDAAAAATGVVIPYVTILISSLKELNLLVKGNTTPLRALAHVALDTLMVSSGITVGSFLGTLAGIVLTAADIGFTGGMCTALAAATGIGGGIFAAKQARKIKQIPLEIASRDYTQAAPAAEAIIKEATAAAERDGDAVVARIAAEFEASAAEVQKDFQAAVRPLKDAQEQDDIALAKSAPALIANALASARKRMVQLQAERAAMGWHAYFPFGDGPKNHAQRLAMADCITALTAAQIRLAQPRHQTETIWTVLIDAAKADPFALVAKLLIEVAERCRLREDTAVNAFDTAQKRIGKIRSCCKESIARAGDRLRERWSSSLEVSLRGLRTLEQRVVREAAAVGKAPNRMAA